MKKLSKEKRDRIVLVGIATAVVLLGAYYAVIGAQKTKLATTQKNIAEQKTRVDNGQRLLKTSAEIEQRLATAASRVKELEGAMATGDMYSWIILKVNKFKAGYAVDIPQFSREVTGSVGVLPKFPYRAATFTLRGTAYFHDLGRFIADFENQFPFIRVQNLELEPAGSSVTSTSDDPEKLAFKMELVALINPLVY